MTPTTPHPEILAAYRKFSGNPHTFWPCQNFTAGFNAGLAAAHPAAEPIDDPAAQAAFEADVAHAAKLAALAQLQPLVMLKLNDAQAAAIQKAMCIESGFDCPDVEATVAGTKYSVPSTAVNVTDPKQIDPMTEAAIRGAIGGMVKQAMTEAGFISGNLESTDDGARTPELLGGTNEELRATCAALRNQSKERGEIITRLRKELEGARAKEHELSTKVQVRDGQLAGCRGERNKAEVQLKDVTDQRDRFRTELAELKAQLTKEAEAKHAALKEMQSLKATLTHEVEAKVAALNDAHRERASHRMTTSRLAIAEAELAAAKKEVDKLRGGWPTPPNPWNLTDLADLIRNRKAGFITEGQFLKALNERPLP